MGASGRIIQWNAATNTWTTVASPTSSKLYGLSFVTAQEGFAVGSIGRIIIWGGSAWTVQTSPVSNTLNSVDFATTTLGYSMSSGGDIVRFENGEFAGETSPVTNAMYGVKMVSSSLGFAVGSGGRILRWDSIPLCNGTSTTGSYGCGGQSTDCENDACSCASENAVFSAGRAYTNLPATINSIGFGSVATCALANTTLQNVALAGNGTYFTSNNASELLSIYLFIAGQIVNQSFVGQIAVVTGNVTTELLPTSYIEFTYTPEDVQLGYREILIPLESPLFPSCTGSFFVPVPFNVSDIKVTSYSASYWTDNVSVRSSATGGVYSQVFKLSDYSTYYQPLGDPYIIQFPPSNVRSNETNYISVGTGYTPTNSSGYCPSSDRAIYKARFSAAVPYGAVLPYNVGHNVSVYYDLDFDGISDGVSYVSYGENTPGYDPAPITVDQLDSATNALDNAFTRLLASLNFFTVPGNSGLPGSSTNPIDIQLSSSIGVQTNSLSEVPYMWGPVEMGVMIWK
ncbi:Uncharacterised protein [Candidatus Burarchaeum australiense]|nr:Uncharacterised protein [Candidatus Burarchaeum australiense]